MDGPPETWRPIPALPLLGIPSGYEASDQRNVRRAGRKPLTAGLDKDGYRTVKLGGRPRRVAVLVQLAWAGRPEVRHLDGDRTNDRPGNLAWGSRVENEQDKKRTEEKNGSGCHPPFPAVTPVTSEQPRWE